MPRVKTRFTSTASFTKPGIHEYADADDYHNNPRGLFILALKPGSVLIGTTNDFPGVLTAVFRNDGMTAESYWLSEPIQAATYALRELRAFCVEISEKHVSLNIFQGISFSAVADKAASLVQGYNSP